MLRDMGKLLMDDSYAGNMPKTQQNTIMETHPAGSKACRMLHPVEK